jgi:hypothetical protein
VISVISSKYTRKWRVSSDFPSICSIIKTPLFHYLNIDPAHPIELDNETESDCLTTLESGETPTFDNGESLTIIALDAV